jgi:GNAT superfamily N-acetyltransferase
MNIRQATAEDAEIIFALIIELAIYEKAEHEVRTTADEIRESMFGSDSKTSALVAEVNNKPVGYAVYFHNYSTWLGKNGLYLEDIYVSPDYRHNGIGKALLQKVANIAVTNNCGRVEWSVLDWNTPAIDFYKSLGAKPQDEWTVYRLTGDELKNFGT